MSTKPGALRPEVHLITKEEMTEIWEGGEFIGAIYKAGRGVRIVSRHKLTASYDASPPNAMYIAIGEDQ